MTILVLCVGKLKEKFFHEAAAEYCKRLGGYCKIEIRELPEERLPDRPNGAQITQALEKEGDALLRLLPPGACVAALCVEGKHLSSPAFAQWMERQFTQGRSKLCFLIGGSYGLAERVKGRADLKLSLSEMTFPHHLARVMLLEQLYRGMKIRGGEEYHK